MSVKTRRLRIQSDIDRLISEIKSETDAIRLSRLQKYLLSAQQDLMGCVDQPEKSHRTPKVSYGPKIKTDAVSYEDLGDQYADVVSTPSNGLNCVICHQPMIACMSVRVSRPVFLDEDVHKIHPVSKREYTEVVSRPSARIGRAHRECAVLQESIQYGFRMVDLRVVPDKREPSMGNRENDRLTDFRSFDQDYRVVNGEVVPFSPDSEDWE